MTVVDLASLGRWIHHFFVARVSPNRSRLSEAACRSPARALVCLRSDGTALALLRNRPVIVDRLPVGFRDVEATIMAAVRARAAVGIRVQFSTGPI